MKEFDRTKSLQQLEQHDLGEATFDSYLVTTCHRLRRKPLDEFTVEDLRIMIGQKIGLPYLLPIALERLKDDPLAAGDYYPGDLLAMVVSADDSFWSTRPDLFRQIREIVRRVQEALPSMEEDERQAVVKLLRDASRSLTG